MDMTGYLGKKVDLICKDGKEFSGYVYDLLEAEESDLGKDSVEIAPLDVMHTVLLELDDVEKVVVDTRYKEFDFRS